MQQQQCIVRLEIFPLRVSRKIADLSHLHLQRRQVLPTHPATASPRSGQSHVWVGSFSTDRGQQQVPPCPLNDTQRRMSRLVNKRRGTPHSSNTILWSILAFRICYGCRREWIIAVMPGFPFAGLNRSVPAFCFLDLEHPAVAWAVMRGMMVSADYASAPPNPGFVSFMQAGMIETLNNRRIFNEFLIERVRLSFFAHQVSRMRGMFFFRSRSEAEARIGDPAWPPYFDLENLLELQLYYDEPFSDVDANWITYAPLAEDGHVKIDDLQWVRRYWTGETYNDHPVWERLAKGVALVLDEQIRRQCYEYVRERFPGSHIPILMARLASEVGTRGGLTAPFLLREDENRVRLAYLWSDAEFHDPMVINAIKEHPDSGALGRMMTENETWQIPDFRPWGRVFELREQNIPGLTAFQVPSLHHPS